MAQLFAFIAYPTCKIRCSTLSKLAKSLFSYIHVSGTTFNATQSQSQAYFYSFLLTVADRDQDRDYTLTD